MGQQKGDHLPSALQVDNDVSHVPLSLIKIALPITLFRGPSFCVSLRIDRAHTATLPPSAPLVPCFFIFYLVSYVYVY